MNLKHIIGNTYMLHMHSNDIVVYKVTEETCVLLDTGLESEAKSTLMPLLEREGLSVIGMINSHAHLDHAGGNAVLKAKYNAKIAAPFFEAAAAESPYLMRNVRNAYRFTLAQKQYDQMRCTVDVTFEANIGSLDFCGVTFGIVPLPGHSYNHCGIVTPDGVMYVGDLMLSTQKLSTTKIPSLQNIEKYRHAIQTLPQEGYAAYVLAHEGVYTKVGHLISMNLHQLDTLLDTIKGLLEMSSTFEQLVASSLKAFNIKPSLENIAYLDEMLKQYLVYLLDTKQVEVFEQKGFAMFRAKY